MPRAWRDGAVRKGSHGPNICLLGNLPCLQRRSRMIGQDSSSYLVSTGVG